MKTANIPITPIHTFNCFACNKPFTNTDQLERHEQNEHKIEFHCAMVREMYGYNDNPFVEDNS